MRIVYISHHRGEAHEQAHGLRNALRKYFGPTIKVVLTGDANTSALTNSALLVVLATKHYARQQGTPDSVECKMLTRLGKPPPTMYVTTDTNPLAAVVEQFLREEEVKWDNFSDLSICFDHMRPVMRKVLNLIPDAPPASDGEQQPAPKKPKRDGPALPIPRPISISTSSTSPPSTPGTPGSNDQFAQLWADLRTARGSNDPDVLAAVLVSISKLIAKKRAKFKAQAREAINAVLNALLSSIKKDAPAVCERLIEKGTVMAVAECLDAYPQVSFELLALLAEHRGSTAPKRFTRIKALWESAVKALETGEKNPGIVQPGCLFLVRVVRMTVRVPPGCLPEALPAVLLKLGRNRDDGYQRVLPYVLEIFTRLLRESLSSALQAAAKKLMSQQHLKDIIKDNMGGGLSNGNSTAVCVWAHRLDERLATTSSKPTSRPT